MKEVTQIPKLPPRPAESHKGMFGKLLLIGGSLGFSGAMALAGRAALRSGAGLVRLAVPRSILPIVAALEPCYTTLGLPEDENGQMDSTAAGVLTPRLEEHDVLAFGPGAGTGAGVKDTLLFLLSQAGVKIVIDADGLNVLAKAGDWTQNKKADAVLTPHPGEMGRLWKGLFREPLPGDRTEQAGRLARKTGCVVVLKGSQTVVTDGERFYINTTGNPGMATAGAGDVLTGMIPALTAQGLSNFEAAVLAVYRHGLAGDLAARAKGQIGLIAADLIDFLPEALLKVLR